VINSTETRINQGTVFSVLGSDDGEAGVATRFARRWRGAG